MSKYIPKHNYNTRLRSKYLKENPEDLVIENIYCYYNCRYSEMGGLFSSLKDALDTIEEEFGDDFFEKSEKREIIKLDKKEKGQNKDKYNDYLNLYSDYWNLNLDRKTLVIHSSFLKDKPTNGYVNVVYTDDDKTILFTSMENPPNKVREISISRIILHNILPEYF